MSVCSFWLILTVECEASILRVQLGSTSVDFAELMPVHIVPAETSLTCQLVPLDRVDPKMAGENKVEHGDQWCKLEARC